MGEPALCLRHPATTVVQGLYGIADASPAPHRSEVALGLDLLAAGVCVLQLRMKDADFDRIRAVLTKLLPACRAAGVPLVLNDHVEIAAEFPGVGVHLGQDDGDPREARRRLGPDVLLGWSTHDREHVLRAAGLPVDYLGFGPVFSAAGKHRSATDRRVPMTPRGLDALAEACREASQPVVAIGGVDASNIGAVRRAGACAAAPLGALVGAPDLRLAASVLVRAWHDGATIR